MDKFSELKAAALAATPGPWGINRTGNTIVSNQSHPVATVSDAFHRQLAGGGVGKDAEFIAAANPDVVLELLAEREDERASREQWQQNCTRAEERIAEMEDIATDYAGKFQKAQDALKYAAIMCDEDKKKIAELEAQVKVWESAALKHLARAEEAEKRLPILEQDKLRLNEIINSEANRADAAEKLLATPVRLPNKNDDEFWFDSVFQVAKFDRAVERAISAAGFKFVGDE
ncbi:ead/Ea22-like family protein [Serratia marcescens]|uniref:ead/Ea22-like family protein n=1 Tax=Serratia marcescens TaxID=615 RepID=UPI00095333EF|nr:ead/Ea22-like family protein [Serratia marcescens]